MIYRLSNKHEMALDILDTLSTTSVRYVING